MPRPALQYPQGTVHNTSSQPALHLPSMTRSCFARLGNLFLLSKHCQSSYKMLTLLLVFCSLAGARHLAAHFRIITDTQLTSNWESGPSGRGTTNILYNSACTLFMCRNSVHLNIPSQCGRQNGITYRRKKKMGIIALFWHLELSPCLSPSSGLALGNFSRRASNDVQMASPGVYPSHCLDRY